MLGTSLYVSSAPIEWGPALNVSTDNDVSTNGSLLEAVNGAYNSFSTNPNVNGVVFVSTGAILNRDSVSDSFTNNSNLNISNNYESLLSTVDFGGGTDTTISLPRNGGTLVVGEEYQIQVWFADTRNTSRVMRYTDNTNNGGSVDLVM